MRSKKWFLGLVLFPLWCNAQSVWNGNIEKWNKGIGIKSDPFIIEKAEHLAYLADGVSDYDGKFFIVTTDIDLSRHNWTPIALFKGNIDFGNHKIILSCNGIRAGLFDTIENASITNLSLEGSIVGIDAAVSVASYAQNSIVKDIQNNASVKTTGTSLNESIYIGGIIAKCINTDINNCHNHGGITCKAVPTNDSGNGEFFTGGIVGKFQSGVLSKSFNTGLVNANYSGYYRKTGQVGGLVGWNNGTIIYCYNIGNIQGFVSTGYYTPKDGSYIYAAGIAGFSSKSYVITSCYNVANIRGYGYTGYFACICAIGACGENCYSTWDLSPENNIHSACYNMNFESNNGIKVTHDELKTSNMVNKLNNGDNVFIKDQYPYINEGYPIINTSKGINVKTENATNILPNCAKIEGAYFCVGYEIEAIGFVLKKLTDTRYDTIYTKSTTYTLNNLLPTSKYCYKFIVKAKGLGIIEGEEVRFSTTEIKSEIFTLENKNENEHFIFNGAIVLGDNEVVKNIGFEVRKESESDYSRIDGEMIDENYFYSNPIALQPGNKYIYRSYAELNVGTIYGEELTFMTSEGTPIMNLYENTHIKIQKQEGGIHVSNNTGHSIILQIYSTNGAIDKKVIPVGDVFLPPKTGIYIINSKKYIM